MQITCVQNIGKLKSLGNVPVEIAVVIVMFVINIQSIIYLDLWVVGMELVKYVIAIANVTITGMVGGLHQVQMLMAMDIKL